MQDSAAAGAATAEERGGEMDDSRLPAFRSMHRLVQRAAKALSAIMVSHAEAEVTVLRELRRSEPSLFKPVAEIKAEYFRLAEMLPARRKEQAARLAAGLGTRKAVPEAAMEDLDRVLHVTFPVAEARHEVLRGASLREKAMLLLSMGVMRPADLSFLLLADESAEGRTKVVDRAVKSAVSLLRTAVTVQARAVPEWPPSLADPEWSPAQAADNAGALDVTVPGTLRHPSPIHVSVEALPRELELLPDVGERTCSSIYAGYAVAASATCVGGTGGYSPATASVAGEWIRVPVRASDAVGGVRIRGTPSYWPTAVSLVATLGSSDADVELTAPSGAAAAADASWFRACTGPSQTVDCLLEHPLHNVSSVKIIIRESHSWCQMQVSVIGLRADE